MPARLIGHRDQTGGKVEVFLLRRLDANYWETLVKPGKKEYRFFSFGDAMFCSRKQPDAERAEELKELEELDRQREADAEKKE